MKKPLLRYSVFVLLIIAAFLPAANAFADEDPNLAGTPPPPPTQMPNGPFIPVEPLAESGELVLEGVGETEEYKLEYSISVPDIKDARADYLNEEFKEDLRYYRDDFAPMFLLDFFDFYAIEGIMDVCSLDVDYIVTYNDGNIMSILFREATTAGDLFSENFTSLTYSFELGYEFALDDVIQTENNPYALAVALINTEIEKVRGTDGDIWGYYDYVNEDLIAAYLSETAFYLNGEGQVVLYLNPICISPCTSGICEFPVPDLLME